MNREEKLNLLIEIIQTLPKKRFNMGKWVEATEESECGFAGCALGWATTSLVFQNMGLGVFTESLYNCDYDYTRIMFIDEYGHEWRDLDAGRQLFELNGEEAHFLFMPSSYTLYNGYGTRMYNWLEDQLDDSFFYKSRHTNISTKKVIKRIEWVRDNPGVLK